MIGNNANTTKIMLRMLSLMLMSFATYPAPANTTPGIIAAKVFEAVVRLLDLSTDVDGNVPAALQPEKTIRIIRNVVFPVKQFTGPAVEGRGPRVLTRSLELEIHLVRGVVVRDDSEHVRILPGECRDIVLGKRERSLPDHSPGHFEIWSLRRHGGAPALSVLLYAGNGKTESQYVWKDLFHITDKGPRSRAGVSKDSCRFPSCRLYKACRGWSSAICRIRVRST